MGKKFKPTSFSDQSIKSKKALASNAQKRATPRQLKREQSVNSTNENTEKPNWWAIGFACCTISCCFMSQCDAGGGQRLPTDAEWEEMTPEEKGKSIAEEMQRRGLID